MVLEKIKLNNVVDLINSIDKFIFVISMKRIYKS